MTVAEYKEYTTALLKMWMDNLIKDSEYYRIIDRINDRAHESGIHERETYDEG